MLQQSILIYTALILIILVIVRTKVRDSYRIGTYVVAITAYSVGIAVALILLPQAQELPVQMLISETWATAGGTISALQLETHLPTSLLPGQILVLSIIGLLATRYNRSFNRSVFPYCFFILTLFCLAALLMALTANGIRQLVMGLVSGWICLQAMAMIHSYRSRQYGELLHMERKEGNKIGAEVLPELLLVAAGYLFHQIDLDPIAAVGWQPLMVQSIWPTALLVVGLLTRSWFGIWIPVRSSGHCLPLDNGYQIVLLFLGQVALRFTALMSLGAFWFNLSPAVTDQLREGLPILAVVVTVSAIPKFLSGRQLQEIVDISGRIGLAVALLSLALVSPVAGRLFLLQVHATSIAIFALLLCWLAADYCKQRHMLVPLVLILLSFAACPPMPGFFIRCLIWYHSLASGQLIAAVCNLLVFVTAMLIYGSIGLSFFSTTHRTEDTRPAILDVHLEEAAASREFLQKSHSLRETAVIAIALISMVAALGFIPLFELWL